MGFSRRNKQNDLRRFWLFADCRDKDLHQISTLGSRVKVPSARALVKQGMRDDQVFIVLAGTATCLVDGERVDEFGPGDFFGEIAALDGGKRTATVIASSDVDVMILDRGEFEVLLEEFPGVARKILAVSAGRLRQANNLAAV